MIREKQIVTLSITIRSQSGIETGLFRWKAGE